MPAHQKDRAEAPNAPPPHKRGPRAGFTLIELMIVVVVIGILASIALPNYLSMKTNAKRASCISNQRGMVPHCTLYAADLGILDGTVSCLAVFQAGYLPSTLTECTESDADDNDDYEITFENGTVVEIDCVIQGDLHPFIP